MAGRSIDDGPPLVVAELSGNHGGRTERALALYDAAVAAGADLVKIQTFTPEAMTLDSDAPDFVVPEGPWAGRRLFDLYAEGMLPRAAHGPLFEHARKVGVPLFSAPFSTDDVAFLEGFDPPAHKIASFELIHLPLIRAVGATGRPVILSVGMATTEEIEDALQAVGHDRVMLLYCNSTYPSRTEGLDLARIPTLRQRFGVSVGFSDHTPNATAAIAATALGARVIEKHFRGDEGPEVIDGTFSQATQEFAATVAAVRATHAGLGNPDPSAPGSDAPSRPWRRSIYVAEDIAAGEVFTPRNIRIVRPGKGLPPSDWTHVLSRTAARRLAAGTPLARDDVA